VSSDVVRGDLRSIEHLSEGLGTLPEDANVISKHVGATYIINKLDE
jgi:hypothetical protein